MQYIFYKKKLINGKKRRVYKKKGSKKLYLKHKGRMVNVVKYKKYLKKKQKKRIGGNITWGQRLRGVQNAAVNLKNTATTKIHDHNRQRAREKREKVMRKEPLNPWLLRNENQTRQAAQVALEKKRQKARQGHTVYGNFGNLRAPTKRWTFR